LDKPGKALAVRHATPARGLAEYERNGAVLQNLQNALDQAGADQFGERAVAVAAWTQQQRFEHVTRFIETVIQHGDQDMAVRCARELARQLRDGIVLPDEAADTLFPLLSSLLMMVGDDHAAEELEDAVLIADKEPATRRGVWHVNLLRLAWKRLRERDFGGALRKGWSIIEDPEANGDLEAEARLVRAEGYRGLGDEERETREREEWYGVYQQAEFMRGPIDFAAAVENTSRTLGATGQERLEALLRSASRLAYLRERRNDLAGARTIYQHLLDQGYHNWVDETMPGLGTISERAQRGSMEELQPPREQAEELELWEPARVYGRVDHDEADRTVVAMMSSHKQCEHAILLDTVEVHENRFRHAGTADVAGTLARCLTASKEEQEGRLQLVARTVQVRPTLRPTATEDWVIVTHSAGEHDLDGLTFGVRPVVIGDEAELAVTALFLPSNEHHPSTRQHVVHLLTTRLVDVPGFQLLRDSVVDRIIAAGRLLSNGDVRPSDDPERVV
jgi:hypothetical protein